jgi:hypothetical protein
MTDSLEEPDQLLLDRAERVFGSRKVGEAIPRVRAIVAPQQFPEGEELATAALQQLRSGTPPTKEGREALVRMICAMRPVIPTRNGSIEGLPEYFEFPANQHDLWARFARVARPFVYSVGRLARIQPNGKPRLAGSGFLIAEGLLVTNLHVIKELFGGYTFVKGAALVGFEGEYHHADSEAEIPILGLEKKHETLDMALLRLAPHPARPPLQVNAAGSVAGTAVATIGYPSRDRSRNPVFADRVFGPAYETKHVAPGEITGERDQCLNHDCTTLGGNSGSPVLLQETAQVAGIHFDSYFMQRNVAVAGPALHAFVAPYLA